MKKMMMFAALVAAGCGAVSETQVVDDPSAPEEDPEEEDPGMPLPEEESCEVGSFLGCVGNVLKACGSDGKSTTSTTCEAGCNAEAARCNECVPDSAACSSNDLLQCGSDGLLASSESCSLGCSEGADAHCEHIVPFWIPNACDVPAQEAQLSITQTTVLDTSNDATCNGGVIPQANGLGICVIRYRTIDLVGNVTVIGSRAPAFVADNTLSVRGILDVGAKANISGPGGGLRISGVSPVGGGGGGGGAGFKQSGAEGGGTLTADGSAGGGTFDPVVALSFEGGPRAASPLCPIGTSCTAGGGGGGAVLVVSCTGAVEVTGTITAGGGGGGGGVDRVLATGSTSFFSGAGGGAGGYVVIQGVSVFINSRVLANGGGGGGGCDSDGCRGQAGQDGTNGGRGGIRQGAQSGDGGRGGNANASPSIVANAARPGGGGGATGRIQIYTPVGVQPVVTTGAQIEPSLEPNRIVVTR